MPVLCVHHLRPFGVNRKEKKPILFWTCIASTSRTYWGDQQPGKIARRKKLYVLEYIYWVYISGGYILCMYMIKIILSNVLEYYINDCQISENQRWKPVQNFKKIDTLA